VYGNSGRRLIRHLTSFGGVATTNGRHPAAMFSILGGYMTCFRTITGALLASTALIATPAFAQSQPPAEEPTAAPAEDAASQEEEVDIAGPGASLDNNEDIVVRGRFIPNPVRATPEVVNVLSAEDIARTGEGDVAGALGRVTGLSVVGGRFVYVRGLGERYSLALLNGSPLPSPEPLRRVVPLDLFPTSILASTVVQKSFSANYPGEFGGGVINLTTRAAPEEGFFDVGFSVSGDSETTARLGYTYFGGDLDWTGFDDGTRNVPRPLAQAVGTGFRVIEGANFTRRQIQDITASLVNSNTSVIQRNNDIPANFSGDIAAGDTIEIGDAELGLIVVASLSNSWRTRAGEQQAGTRTGAPGSANEALVESSDFRYITTENRLVANAMFSGSLTFGEHRIRATSLYIRDTLKEARIATGNNFDTVSPSPTRPDATLQTGLTTWYERQLVDLQLLGEFEFDDLAITVRGSGAESQRNAPYERNYSYAFNETVLDYVNDLRSPGQTANISFSELTDTVWSGGIDVAYRLPFAMDITVSAGYAYYDNDRSAIRRDYQFFPSGALPLPVAQQRIDFLLSDYNVYAFNVLLRDTTGALGSASYDAGLTVNAGYLMAEAELLDGLTLNVGVRYEDATQTVTPNSLFGAPALAATRLDNDYFLPAATLTWNFAEDMQLRLAASRTIARPQFRELAPQPYRDTESQRTFFGNQFLTDSELLNVEARYEWYFGRDQQLSIAGFYKDIDNPIEATAVNLGSSLITSFTNAPRAELYGAEIELRRYFPLSSLGGAFEARRLAVIGNYSYTDSRIIVNPGDTTISFTSQPAPIDASLVFDTTRRLRLTGQSQHLVNVQFSLEHEDRLSQQSILITYASERTTQRGPNLTPDIIERPGLRLDVVLREGIEIGNGDILELKFEARNLTGTDYSETQRLNGSQLIINSYDIGTSFSLGATLKF
jgi:outer membrane receptor protein involved in Fe transport